MMAAGTEQYITVADPSLLPVLPSSIDNVVTSFSVSATARLPVLKTGQTCHITIDTETMEVTGISGTTLTVVRGSEGTTATSHLAGAAVSPVLSAEALRRLLPIINVQNPPYGLSPLIGDNSTLNDTAMTAIIAALPTTGFILFFPAGVYKFASTINFTNAGFSNFALMGTSVNVGGGNVGTVLRGGGGGTLVNIDRGGNLNVSISNIRFDPDAGGTGLYVNLATASSFHRLGFNGGANGIVLLSAFSSSLYSCGFNAITNIGASIWGATNVNFFGCDWVGCYEGLRAYGSSCNMFGGRFEANHIGINIGLDEVGSNRNLDRSAFEGITFEANDYGLWCHVTTYCKFSGLNIPGTANAPSGAGITGLTTGGSYCTYSSINVPGNYTSECIKVNGGPSIFDCVQATNALGGTVWNNLGSGNVSRLSNSPF